MTRPARSRLADPRPAAPAAAPARHRRPARSSSGDPRAPVQRHRSSRCRASRVSLEHSGGMRSRAVGLTGAEPSLDLRRCSTAAALATGPILISSRPRRPRPGDPGLAQPPQPLIVLPGLALALVVTLAGGESLGPENPIIGLNLSLAVRSACGCSPRSRCGPGPAWRSPARSPRCSVRRSRRRCSSAESVVRGRDAAVGPDLRRRSSLPGRVRSPPRCWPASRSSSSIDPYPGRSRSTSCTGSLDRGRRRTSEHRPRSTYSQPLFALFGRLARRLVIATRRRRRLGCSA